MRYFFIIVYMLLLPVTIIAMLWKILDTVEELREENSKENKEESKPKRKHLSVGQSDFDNAFGGRKAYSMFKNQNGLYEPVTPSKGIEIKKKEE